MEIDLGPVILVVLFAYMILKLFGNYISDYRQSRKAARALRKAKRKRIRELNAANAVRIKEERDSRMRRELKERELKRKERESRLEQARTSIKPQYTPDKTPSLYWQTSGQSVEQSVADIIESLHAALPDAAKHDRGIKVAGTRLRKAMQSIKNSAQDVRIKVQSDRNSR
jgi:mannosyltransferase OCH1-like enzyme